MRFKLQILGLNRSMLLQLYSEHLTWGEAAGKRSGDASLNFRVIDQL